MRKRILILSGIQPSTNPRVIKEADALADEGYDVEVLGTTVDASLLTRDQEFINAARWKYTSVLDVVAPTFSGRLKATIARGKLRFWSESFSRTGIGGVRMLGLGASEMYRYCLQHPANLYIAHNPDSLWPAANLIAAGFKVGVDMEDWYSEDLRVEDREKYPIQIVRDLERAVLGGATCATTTSQALAKALSETYGCAEPVTVHNSYSIHELDRLDRKNIDRVRSDVPSLCWVSQVIGPDRGLETLMDALGTLHIDIEVHLRGSSRQTYIDSLLQRLPSEWRSRVHFHPQVSQSELISRVAEHDIGFSGEVPYCRNKDLTIANKIPLYLLAGLAVVASDTRGNAEAALAAKGAISLFEANDSVSLGRALQDTFTQPERLQAAREAARTAARAVFNWEVARRHLVEEVHRAFG